MITELEMKEALDGRFFWFDHKNERIGCSLVPKDYIPDHCPEEDDEAKSILVESGRRGGRTKRRAWTLAEDELLLELRAKGLRWQHVGKQIGRGDKGARARYKELCKAREIAPTKCNRAKRNMLTMAQKREIIRLVGEGLTFPEIDAALGLPDFWARDYCTRYRREQNALRLAA